MKLSLSNGHLEAIMAVSSTAVAMNLSRCASACLIGLGWCLLSSCNSEDPSAAREGQRALAEARANNTRLAEEIANLQAELEAAKSKINPSEAIQIPGAAEIEKKLELEGLKLKEEVRQLHPGATEVGFITADLTIPSFERPFSCKAKVVFKEAGGTLNTLYWTGSANIKGEWQFAKADHWDPKVVRKPPEITFTPAPPVAPPPPVEPTPPPVSVTPATKGDAKYLPLNTPLNMGGSR